MMKTQTGVTLIEMMIALAVLAFLITVAIPGFQELFRGNRVVTQANQVLHGLALARSEAVKRSAPITICKNNGASPPGCNNANNNVWESGWIIFADANGNGAYDAGEEILVEDATAAGYSVRTTNNYQTIQFLANGTPNFSDTFKVCRPDADTQKSRSVTINAIGRASVTEGTTACP